LGLNIKEGGEASQNSAEDSGHKADVPKIFVDSKGVRFQKEYVVSE
jgi:hypothetical protein